MLSIALLVAGGGMVNLLFLVLFALLICYAISRLAPEPVKTVGYIIVAALVILYVWRGGMFG